MANSSDPDSGDGHVRKVKDTWRQFEDYGLAHKLQNEEFNQHYDQNRCERRLMQGDIRYSKEEQKQEDVLAAEYYEQLRYDQEKRDERMAAEIHRRLQMEEGSNVSAQRARELEDEMLARRLQELEMAKQKSNPNHVSPGKSNVIIAGPSNGPYRPAPSRHASVPSAPHHEQDPRWNQQRAGSTSSHGSPSGSSGSSGSSTSPKKTPPPRPPPPRHNSSR